MMKRAKRILCVTLCILLSFHFLTISSVAEIKVYRSVITEKKRVALTFDDGPHPSLTPKILEILAR